MVVIWVDVEVKEALDELKVFPGESYSSVIRRLIQFVMDMEPLSEEAVRRIEEALEDVREGRVYSTSEAERMLGGSGRD